jgi:M6 family metalloprotease-like protein
MVNGWRRPGTPLAVWVVLVAGQVGPSAPLEAQQFPRGELGRPEVQGLDFDPNGAWRRRTGQVREYRREQLRTGNFSALNRARPALAPALRLGGSPELSVLTGTVNVPVILIAYSNVAVAYPTSDFQNVIFSPTPGLFNRPYSLKTFYEELSSGFLSIGGTVFDPVRVDSTDVYYQDNCNGIGVTSSCPNARAPFKALLRAALDSINARAGADVFWGQFDNDGADGLPNSGDDDGNVDFVTFVHPTRGGECTTPGIWAHRWTLSFLGVGSYPTRTPRNGSNGQPLPGQFIQVNDYIIQSQLGGDTGCDGNRIMPIGTIAHETGHAFGLPDLYDTDPSSRTQGSGEWSLMGSGNFAMPNSPSSYDAWSLAELGWVTLRELTANQTVTTGPRQFTDTVFVARTNDTPSQYFLLENRQSAQSDTAQMNPISAKRKLPGLLVWLIDLNRIASGRGSNTINTGAIQGVALMQADGLNQLRTTGSRNRGDIGDSYPGSTGNTSFGYATNPAARTNQGSFAGFLIDRIEQLAGQVMRFRYTRRVPSLFQSSRLDAAIRVNGATVNRFEDVVPAGDVVQLAADSVQLVSSGRTQLRFLSWSNGGSRTQALTSGAAPDTVTAQFTAQHRLLAVAQGGGTFTSSVVGDIAGAGVFVDEGAQVTLTAVTQPGLAFAGWQGDTIAVTPQLRLPMAHPYDVSAVFLQEQIVPMQDATDDLLGVPKLTPSQHQYLDQLGNRNGGYDVGDYLALVNRSGATVSPALLARMAAARKGNP